MESHRNNEAPHDIAFIFNNVNNYQSLVEAFQEGVEVHVLDAQRDGLEQIAAILAGREGFGALHVMGHGAAGELQLGTLRLDLGNVGAYADVLGRIGSTLAPGGDILLYGCDIAAGAAGMQFVAQIAHETGADVAASTDATGDDARGGNWALEYHQGNVSADAAFDVGAVRSLDTLLAIPAAGVKDVTGTMDLTPGNFVTGFTLGSTVSVVQDPGTAPGGDGVYFYSDADQDTATKDATFTVQADNSNLGSFDLSWVDFDKYSGGVPAAFMLTVTGYKPDGTVKATLNIHSNAGAAGYDSTPNFAAFTGIVKYTVRIVSETLINGGTVYPVSNWTFDGFTIANPHGPNVVTSFLGGSTLNVFQSSGANSVLALLHVNDTDDYQTLAWTQQAAPSHGTLSISGGTATGGSTDLTPGGSITYTPTNGYVGTDTFTVQVYDGFQAVQKTITVNVNVAKPSVPDLTTGDSGSSATDNITNAGTLTFQGTGAAGDSTSQVRVFMDVNRNGSFDAGVDATGTTTMGGGSWTASLSTSGVPDGNYNVYALSTNGANTSLSDPLSVTVDKTAPTVTISSDKSTLKAGETAQVTFTFSEDPGTSFTSADLGIGGGTLGALSGSGNTRTATFTPTANTNAGTATLSVTNLSYSDTAGNNGSGASMPSISFDTLKPSVTITSNASTLKVGQTANITFTFTEDPGSSFIDSDISVTGGTLGAISGSGTTRTAVFTPTPGTNGGTASITIAGGAYTDAAGNAGNAGTTPSLTFDTLAPTAPTISITTGSDKGFSSSDGITNVTTPVLTGTAEAGATVTLYDTDGSTVIGSGTANGGGIWTITTTTLGTGAHTITAKATDAAGNTGVVSPPLALTIDTTAPTVAITSDASTLGPGQSANITFTFSEDPGTTFTAADISVSGGTLGALSGSGNVRTVVFTPAANSAGTATITVAADSYTDAAGNLGAAGTTPALTYDTSSPTVAITSSVPALKIGETATITFTFSQDPGSSFTLDDVTILGGTFGTLSGTGNTRTVEFTPTPDTNGGTASITVAAGSYTDAASHPGVGATFTNLVFDTLAPAAPAALAVTTGSDKGFSSSDGVTNIATPTLTGTAEDGTTVKLYDTDGTTVIGTTTASGGTWTITATSLLDGSHTLTAKATDAAGNTSAVSAPLAVTIDTAPPTLAITSDVGALRTGQAATITFTFSENPGTTFTSDDVTVTGGTLGAITGTGLARTATFTPADNFEGSASITVSGGTYTDTAGNDGGAGTTPSLAIDTIAPTVTIGVGGPSTLKIGDTALVMFSFSEDPGSNFTPDDVTVEGGTLSGWGGGGFVHTAVFTPDPNTNGGIGKITVNAGAYTDGAGNPNAVVVKTVPFDTLAPAAPSVPDMYFANDTGRSDSDNLTKETAPTLMGTAEAGSTVTVYDTDGTELGRCVANSDGDWFVVPGMLAGTHDLAAGTHTITAKAVDEAGNVSSASAALVLTVDNTAPTVTIGSDKASLKAGETATITLTFSEDPGPDFSASQVTFSSGTVGAMTGSGNTRSFVFTPAADSTGTASISIAASAYQDAAGNDGIASIAMSLPFDTILPKVVISSDADNLKIGQTANITFAFTEDPGSSFTDADITVTGGHLGAISGSGTSRTAVFTPDANTNGGSANISVGAGTYSDAAGNGGEFAAKSLAFDTLAPAAPTALDLATLSDTGTSNSDDLTSIDTPTITGTAEANATVKLYDSDGLTMIGSGSADSSGHWEIAAGSLGSGTHNITAVATDAFGNSSAASSALPVTVDRTAPTLSITSSAASLAIGQKAIITFTFSEDPGNTFTWDGTSGDIVVSGGTLGAISGTGNERTAEFTPAPGTNSGVATISVARATWTDAAGNDGGAGSSPSLTFDTLAPTLAITTDMAQLKAGQTALVTFTFSEIPLSFDASDIVVAGGTLGAITGAGTTRTAVFTPNADTNGGTGTITVAGGYTDANGNAGSGANASVAYDTLAPAAPSAPTLDAATDTGASNSDGITAGGTPPGPSGERILDFTVNAEPGARIALIDDITGTELSYTTASPGGIAHLAFLDPPERVLKLVAVATDTAGNVSSKSAVTTVVFDRTAPAPISLALVADTGSAGGDGVTTNGHIQVSGIEAGATWQYSLNGGTSWLAGSGSEIQLTADGAYSVIARQVDVAGNQSADSAALALQLDTAAPHANVTLDRTILARGQTAQVTVDFGEKVTGFADSAVTPANGTLSGFTTADGGRTWTAILTPTTLVSDTTNVISVDNTGVLDAAGNLGTGTSTSPNYQVQTAAPVASVNMSDTHLLVGETATVTFSFGQVVSGFTLADVTAQNGTLAGLASADGGATWTATFTPKASISDTTNVITVANTGVTNSLSQVGIGTSDSANYEVLTVRPTASVNVAQRVLAPGANTTVTITFSEAVTGFDNADLTVNNATLSAVASSDGGKTWTATLTAGADVSGVTGRVILSLPGVQNLDGNAGVGTVASGVYTVGPLTPPGGGSSSGSGGGATTVQPVTDPITGLPGQIVTVPTVPASGSTEVGIGSPGSGGGNSLTATLPGGIGLQASGTTQPLNSAQALLDLIGRIDSTTTAGSATQSEMKGIGAGFINSLGTGVTLESRTLVLSASPDAAPDKPIVISGTAAEPGAGSPAVGLVIDAHSLPKGSVIQLDNVDFAAVVGDVRLFGGAGRNMVVGDGGSQTIYLGPDDDILSGGAGDDFIGSAGGDDILDGGDGNDLVVGGIGNDKVMGGSGNDVLNGGRSTTGTWDFYMSATGAIVARHGGAVFTPGGSEMVQASELDASAADLGFLKADPQQLAGIALLYDALGRTPDLGGLSFWSRPGVSLRDVAQGVLGSAEFFSGPLGQAGDEAFLRGVYQQVLGRAPDDAGLAWWLARLSGADGHPAASRIDVLTAVAISLENKVQALGADGYKIGAATVKELGWFSGSGDDVLEGGPGNDILVGGDGRDTAVFAGNQAGYRILIGADHQLRVVQTASGDVDTLSGIESAKFDDGTVDFTFLKADPALVNELGMLYQALLDRPGDAGGFNFWLLQHLNGQQLVQAFTQTAEFQAHFAGMNDAAFVHELYECSDLAATAVGGEQSWQAYLANHTRAELIATWITQDEVVRAQVGTQGLWLV